MAWVFACRNSCMVGFVVCCLGLVGLCLWVLWCLCWCDTDFGCLQLYKGFKVVWFWIICCGFGFSINLLVCVFFVVLGVFRGC